MTTIHIFRCSTKSDQWAATQDSKGENLSPVACEGGDWEFYKTINISPDEPPRIGLNQKELSEALDRDGYYVWNAGVYFGEVTTKPKRKDGA